MRLKCIFGIICIMVLYPLSSHAIDFSAGSRTYFHARENAEDDLLLPLHEYLDFHVDGFDGKEISLHFGGWVRQDLNSNESFDQESSDGDLQYAYISLQKKKMNGFLNLGRVQVFEGIASEIVDGIHLGSDISAGFHLSAYGGIPVETDFDNRDKDYIYGGRIAHSLSNIYMMGVSYLNEQNDGDAFREEVGLDVWIRPINKLGLSGISRYNADTSGWMEHSYHLALGPFSVLRLIGTASWINYEDYYSAVTSPAFTLRSDIIDPDEEVLILGGLAEIDLGNKFSVNAEYKNYDYKEEDSADYYGGGVRYSDPGSYRAGLSAYRMDGQKDELKYFEYRAYAYKKFQKFDLTLDLFDVAYDEQINDIEHAYSITLAAGYDMLKNMRFVADIDYIRNPEFDSDVRAFLKLLYTFTKS